MLESMDWTFWWNWIPESPKPVSYTHLTIVKAKAPSTAESAGWALFLYIGQIAGSQKEM